MNKLWSHLISYSEFGSLTMGQLKNRFELLSALPDDEALQLTRAQIEHYLAERAGLNALQTHYSLESASPLLLLHLIRRQGERNRLRSGLQQSYGDHTRMLAHAIDRMVLGDADWLASRVWPREEIQLDRLEQCCASLADIGIGRAQFASLWVAAALHDYGKLYGRRDGPDPEDAEFVAKPIVESVLAADLVADTLATIRFHDSIERVSTGETPTKFISSSMDRLPDRGSFALVALGIIQLGGAASLGEGRIVGSKIELFLDCISGRVMDPKLVNERASLLFGAVHEPEHGFRTITAIPRLEIVDEVVADFLENAVLYNWPRFPGYDRYGTHADMHKLLQAVSEIWVNSGRPRHLVFAPSARDKISLQNGFDQLRSSPVPSLLNGDAIIGLI